MAGAGNDAEYAAAVLEGRVATKGAWRSPGAQNTRGEDLQFDRTRETRRPGSQRRQGRQAGGGAASARSDGAGGRSGKKARHGGQQQRQEQQQKQQRREQRQNQQQQQQQQQQGSIAGAAAAEAAQDASGTSSLTAYSQPGPRSTARVAHCTACDVFVPRRPGDWEVHVAGIRHRRQLLSLRTFGERNRLVLSAFESVPDSEEAAHRLVGKAALAFGLLPGQGGQGSSGAAAAPEPEPGLLQAARQLRTEALKQLLNLFGVGQMYNSASADFEERRLAACLHQACRRLEGYQQSQRQQQQQGGQGDLPTSSSSGGSVQHFTVGTGAELAALVHLALTGRVDAAELAVALAPEPADAPRSQHAALAAALQLLLPALHRSSTLACLRLALPAPGGADTSRLAQLWQQAWQHVLPALRALLESSAPLRDIHLALPGCLHEATSAYLPQLQAAAEASPVAVRQHVLLALHPRAGRCSLLQLLPLAVLREVLDLAAPLQPCAVHVTAAAAAAGGGAAG